MVNIFNLFITYGDTFLPSPTSYDELYYEIIRVHQIFDNLYSMGESDKLVCCSFNETLFARSQLSKNVIVQIPLHASDIRPINFHSDDAGLWRFKWRI